MGLVREVLAKGGKITPLYFKIEDEESFPSLMNPSIFIYKDQILCNIRNTNYILYHSEYTKEYSSIWGPLSYIHPEDDRTLTTRNIICELDRQINIQSTKLIDTAGNDTPPNWEFIGLEDCRLFSWEDRLYVCGVRRDVKSNGEGRMELCEVEMIQGKYVEKFRIRIHPPTPSYCEKNWMPILDLPFHFIKWTSPLEIISVNPELCLTLNPGSKIDVEGISVNSIPGPPENFRGGSQVIRIGDIRLCIIHEVDLKVTEVGRKDGTYRHRFIAWDLDWNVVWKSLAFNFMDSEIEFCCGMVVDGENILISFSVQDNCSYILTVPITYINEWRKS